MTLSNIEINSKHIEDWEFIQKKNKNNIEK